MRLASILLLISISCFGQEPWKDIYSSKAWEARDKWQKADELIGFLELKNGSVVADVGCHEGYMTFKLASVVDSNGKVYAVDIDQAKLEKINKRAKEKNISNIQTIKGDFDNPKLPLNQLDAVIILDTYHEMKDHNKILQHIKKALKTGGRLVICEPIADERKNATRAAQEKKHEIAMLFVFEDLKKAGFKTTLMKDPFIDRTKEKGDKMWVAVAVKI
jgi:ubiquinone/menaquinone biosynthesis C-methylase UbiE